MKLNCIIDTCSCVYLSRAEFQQKSLLKYLFDNATIHVSKEVNLEITDHAVDGIPKFIQSKKLILKPVRYSNNDYETRVIGKVLPSRKKKGDKGEIDNFIVAVDQTHHLKKGATIYITDDRKALRGNLDIWKDAFPGISYWSSYDVVLFLYAQNIIPSKDIAVEMVKEIIAVSAPIVSERNEDTTKNLTSILKVYNMRIEKISQIFK